MFCNYCGKQIKENTKFCPYCGKNVSPAVKTINIDSNITADALRKRAFIMIEDGDPETASVYLDRLLDLQPEDAQAYLGKLIIEKGVLNKNELIDYYKNLFDNEQLDIKTVTITDDDRKHINDVIEEQFIPFYLDKGVIDSLYKEFDFTYTSLTPAREIQKINIDNEFENNHKLSRMMKNANKKLKDEFNDIKNTYQIRLRTSQLKDEEQEEKIRADYKTFIDKTDERVRTMHDAALMRRENDYQNFSERIDTSMDINELNNMKSAFILMGDYKEAKSCVDRCDEKILVVERILKEQQERTNRKIKRMIIGAFAVVIMMVVAVLIYQFVIVPENKYKQALAYLEKGDYETAIYSFEELDNYKDSEDQLKTAIIKRAQELIDKQEYQEATDILEPLNREKEAKDTICQAKYGLSIQKIEEKKYSEAISILDTIIDYKDAGTRKMQAIYETAIVLRENKEYDKAMELFDQVIDYEDAAEQKAITEKNKKDDSVAVPKVNGRTLYDVKSTLDRLGLVYTTVEKESQEEKAGTVIDVTPAVGTILYKGSQVQLTVTKGLSKYDSYRSDGNSSVLYQINITPAAKQIYVRRNPHIDPANKIDEMAKAGESYNVYETVRNEGYTWIRTDGNKWFATDTGWIEQDSYCTSRGDYNIVKAWIRSSDGSGVYDKPVENSNNREWLERLDYGTDITIYYRFYNGSHYWYKIGANKWIKDSYGEKIAYY